ncbi:bacillithiol biosynthesis cysteine-adding enzyme BshC [Oceanobacillus jeddahense]|uniref:Putative cysteine ligase BshC n=1 Tax=Oceanobacillus jeddahense TaxID=1462527 RepID=A0ABY5JMV1_9BACI|nr:bacillithiol biosynthesis cysteine-adding enzyme BshC [Oceanobacillus jeddahense]UUI01635.1 bacillithiol biosynthesis cysteine-adding enzyme BshC [Oceanobacillus jeddahense]
MQINSLTLPAANRLVADYKNEEDNITNLFDYHPYKDFHKRLQDLSERDFNRNELTNVLHTLNKQWGAPEETLKQIERLNDEKSTVVIGGQQAGLLTGPIYTINKIITILELAKQQEKVLGKPVIPVFWIAGEDHDFEEINHIHCPTEDGDFQKLKLHTKSIDAGKKAVSELEMDKKELSKWIEAVFETLPETAHTKDIYMLIQDVEHKASNYIDFFARLIFELFPKQGIVLVDSGNSAFRKLETDCFLKLIQKQSQISESVVKTLKVLEEREYPLAIEAAKSDGNLFYHDDIQGRILLRVDENGDWVGKQQEMSFTEKELKDIARNTPWKLSNNVVTRPIMQEYMFPTLAFIAGPGEIAYWAALKSSFHVMNMQIPPVVPRVSLTFLDTATKKLVTKYQLTTKDVILNGVQSKVKDYMEMNGSQEIDQITEDVAEKIKEVHQPIRDMAANMGDDIQALSKKNLAYLLENIQFMNKRFHKEFEKKHSKVLSEFNQMEQILHPHGGLQERVWNPLFLLNHYGIEFISQLTSFSLDMEKGHWVVE